MDEQPKKRLHLVSASSQEQRNRNSQRLRSIPVFKLLPSVITLFAMYLGFTSISMALAGKFQIAIYLIIVAAILDSLDGRVARFVKSDQIFGAELDSLADFLNFGIAPAFIIWMWGLEPLGSFGWGLAFFFILCCALRLARFNATLIIQNRKKDKRYFTGVPAPLGGLLVLSPIYMSFVGLENPKAIEMLLILCAVGSGLLMISHLKTPTWSSLRSSLRFRTPRGFLTSILLLGAIVGVMIFNFPFMMLLLLGLAYLGNIFFIAFRSYYLD